VTSDNRGFSWSDTVRISDGTVNMDLRSPSIGKHPRLAGIGGTSFEGGADLLWTEPDASETDGNSIHYGRIPWVEVTGVKNDNNQNILSEYHLSQNYPNPFNPTTNIEFKIKASGKVQLKVYNMLGEEVATIIDKQMAAGFHRINFDASTLTSGIYFYKLMANEFVATKKMIIMK
jgi:hypothetical protein